MYQSRERQAELLASAYFLPPKRLPGFFFPSVLIAITHTTMLLEDERFIHEELERLEHAIADRVAEEPRNVSLLCAVRFERSRN